MKPQFIAVEGLEGAGKSTAIMHIQSLLNKAGVNHIVTTREPGGTGIAEQLRGILKHHPTDEILYPETECLLFYAARVQTVNTIVKPALAKGHWVITDRHELSSRAYQIGGRGLASALLEQIHAGVIGDFWPDFTLYLDIEPTLGLARAGKRGALDRFEQEELAFFERTRAQYLQLVQHYPHIALINANAELAQVRLAISAALCARYPALEI